MMFTVFAADSLGESIYWMIWNWKTFLIIGILIAAFFIKRAKTATGLATVAESSAHGKIISTSSTTLKFIINFETDDRKSIVFRLELLNPTQKQLISGWSYPPNSSGTVKFKYWNYTYYYLGFTPDA